MKYIGCDVHSKHSYFVVMDEKGRVLHRTQVLTEERSLLRVIEEVSGKKSLVFEEGVMSQWMYLLLKDKVDDLKVCQPAKRVSGPKTDWIDATDIADLLRVGRLKTVYHSADKLMDLRGLVSGYTDVQQQLVRTKNRYNALFRQQGVHLPSDGYEDAEILQTLPRATDRYVGQRLYKQLELLQTHKSQYVAKFQKNAETIRPVKLLSSIPGFGPIRSNIAVGVMVTPHRFSTKYKLYAYAQLVKHEQRSDERIYGRRRSCGQPALEEVFKSAAMSNLRSKNAFRRKYDDVRTKGGNDGAARNAVARVLAATVLGVWKHNTMYDESKRGKTNKKEMKTT